MKVHLITFWLCALWTFAADWPQFLGPARDGSVNEEIATSWDQQEPRTAWKKKIGHGFAGPIVHGSQVIAFHREGDSEIIEAFDAATGAGKWRNEMPTQYRDDFGFDPGPRAVPCVSGDKVYAMGADGLIRCVDLLAGKTVWSVPAREQFKAGKGFFGMACSPLVEGTNVILNIGGESGAGVVALDKNTGKLRWKSRDDEASYSSPITAFLGGVKYIVAFTRQGLCLLHPENGAQKADFPWRARMNASVNAATPLVFGNMVFVTASYGLGAALLEWNNGALKKLWSNDDSLSSHYATPVVHRGYLYGFHGRQEDGPEFRCVDFKTGRVMWAQTSLGAGTVTRIGEQLLLLRESGELTLIAANTQKFEQRGNIQILGSDVRAYPAYSEKRLFARDKTFLVCVSLP